MPVNERHCDKPDQPAETNDRALVGRMLHLISRKHFQYCEAKLQSVDIGPGQVPILIELSKNGQMSQRDLADKVRVTPATISGTLKRLERGGVIRREGDESDARVSLVSLTDEGRKRMEAAHSIFQEADRRLTEYLTNEECETLIVNFRKMLAVLEADEQANETKEGNNA